MQSVIVDNCRRLARRKGWELLDFAASAGISASVAAIAMGIRDGDLRLRDLEAIAGALSVSVALLCSDVVEFDCAATPRGGWFPVTVSKGGRPQAHLSNPSVPSVSSSLSTGY